LKKPKLAFRRNALNNKRKNEAAIAAGETEEARVVSVNLVRHRAVRKMASVNLVLTNLPQNPSVRHEKNVIRQFQIYLH
jgi:hypothetical protein